MILTIPSFLIVQFKNRLSKTFTLTQSAAHIILKVHDIRCKIEMNVFTNEMWNKNWEMSGEAMLLNCYFPHDDTWHWPFAIYCFYWWYFGFLSLANDANEVEVRICNLSIWSRSNQWQPLFPFENVRSRNLKINYFIPQCHALYAYSSGLFILSLLWLNYLCWNATTCFLMA